MKPIKLKIKGLNSFIDTQEIDFSELTSRGLFGIFGPTGSGKSTILDGITLALYGAVARGSSNYMNTNCDALNVSYEFQISEKDTRKYRVEREFRRDKKTGSVRSKSAKIVHVTQVDEIILEEQPTHVTVKCEEIIGLKLEDFTRTVVLPQGKFSEFLKLEGKERREMLERLFNLQKYGDELSSRLAGKIKQEKEKANVLEGELKTFEDCSEKILEEKTAELSALKEKVNLSCAELKKAEEDFTEGKQLWDLQSELKQHTLQKIELEKRDEEIKACEDKANRGERSLKVKPYLDSYENTLGQIETTRKGVAELEKAAAVLALNKINAEARLEETQSGKDNELPALKIREQSVAEAVEEKKKLNSLSLEKSTLQAGIGKLESDLEATQKKADKNIADINTMNSDILDKDKRVENLSIAEDYKKKINEAIVILSYYENADKQVKSESAEIEKITTTIQTAQAKAEELSKALEAKAEALQTNNLSLQNLTETSPGDQDSLIALQEKLNWVKDKWNKYEEYSVAVQKSQEFIENLSKELAIQPRKVELEQEISKIEQDLKKIETENMAHILREKLLEGEACPVCGSKDHHSSEMEVFDFGNIEQIQAALNEKKDKHRTLAQQIFATQENIKIHEKNLKESQEKIEALGEEYKAFVAETLQNEFAKLKMDITQYNVQKNELEKQINRLSEEKNELAMKQIKADTVRTENEGQLETRQKNLNLAKEKLEAVEKELAKLKAELGVEDFKSKQDEIMAKEKQKAALERELKQLREALRVAQEQKELLNKGLADLRGALQENNAILIEKDKNIEEKRNSIKAKVGEVEDLERYQKEIAKLMFKIEQDYAEADKKSKNIEQQYNECHTRQISAQNSLQSLTERSLGDKDLLDKALREEDIKDIDEVKSNLLDKTTIDKFRAQIQEYRASLDKITGAIENLNKKIGDKSLTEAQWLEIQKIKDEKTRLLKDLDESKIKLETNVSVIKDKLVEKTKRLKTKEELDQKLSLLDDLEKLFKGKKFVEFVAAHQLQYVSIEAGKKLKEITGGNFGLEVDENGKFLIRDYKNGGAQRDASTLSGGETFLASLSLALALSAQIQLKGTAPLELFFLDEGFGTLDDNLLEVVMDSLEKIHNDRLSIGIISHVESIKNRVPMKLIVNPAKAGMGGSKVGIEVS